MLQKLAEFATIDKRAIAIEVSGVRKAHGQKNADRGYPLLAAGWAPASKLQRPARAFSKEGNAMTLPGFTAQASTYRSQRHYIGSASSAGGSPPAVDVMPAYRPGPETRTRCQSCLDGCTTSAEICVSDAWLIMLGCIFPPDCAVAAAATGEALASCAISNLACRGGCELFHCCPKICGFPNPLDPGSG